MASLIASVSQGIIPTTLGLPISQITAAPQLTHQRELLRRAETIDSATCGWVNGDYSDALVCAEPYHQPCLWNSDLHVVGCCAASATADCNWKTSCVPWASVNYGCDSDCQKNTHNLICPSDRPLCAKATFNGPSGYSYVSCTDKDATTETVYLTWQGGDATVQDLPRYYASYWSSSSSSTKTTNTKSSGTATKSSATATSTSSSSNSVGSWIQRHKWAVIGAVIGVLIVVLLLIVCCACHIRRKRKDRSRGVYVPPGQAFPGTQEAVPLTGYKPYKINYANT